MDCAVSSDRVLDGLRLPEDTELADEVRWTFALAALERCLTRDLRLALRLFFRGCSDDVDSLTPRTHQSQYDVDGRVKLEQWRNERRPRQGLQLIGDDLMQYRSRSHGGRCTSASHCATDPRAGDEQELEKRSRRQHGGGEVRQTGRAGGVYTGEQSLAKRSSRWQQTPGGGYGQ